MAGRPPFNAPPQTGIIDFLRRLAGVNNSDLLDAFKANPVHTMSTAGLTQAQQDAIMSGDNARIGDAVGNDFFAVHSADYIRQVRAVAKVPNVVDLDFTFPDDGTLSVSAQDTIANLRRTVDRISAQLDSLSAHFE